MNETDVFVRFGIALIVGLGIGIERGYSQKDIADGQRAVGVRTFAFLALIGAASGMSTSFAGPWLLAATSIGVIAFLIAAYRAGLSVSPDLGLTTEMASIATFVAGALAGAGLLLAAALTGAAGIMLLHNKQALHRLTAGIQGREIDAAVKVLAIAAIIVPLAPDKGFGPGAVLNPRELALAVVVIASLGLVGYAAIRVLGSRMGLTAFGLAGGLVSSTGVAIGAAKLARAAPGHEASFAAATALAQTVMFLRTGLLASTLNPILMPVLLPPLAAGASVAALAAMLLSRNHVPQAQEMHIGSPDTLNAALRFVSIAAAAMLVAAVATDLLGALGLYVSGFVAGLADVDAATVTAARVSTSGASAGFALLLALTANSLSKTVIAWRLGGRVMGVKAGTAFLGSALAAALTYLGLLIWAEQRG